MISGVTLYTGLRITSTTELFFDAESAGGHGLSNGLGLMGLTNADVVRNPDLGPKPYLARLMIRPDRAFEFGKDRSNSRPPLSC